jgi:16S rRNA (guanine966-N2)-methyltransferase
VLEQVGQAGLLTPGGMLVIEHDKREPAPETHQGFSREDQRRFGDTLVSFYRVP